MKSYQKKKLHSLFFNHAFSIYFNCLLARIMHNYFYLFSGKPKELMFICRMTWDIPTWFKLEKCGAAKLSQVEMALHKGKLKFSDLPNVHIRRSKY